MDSITRVCSRARSSSLPTCSLVALPQSFLPREQLFQPTTFRDFTIYLTFFIMMIISSASPVRPDPGGGTGRDREAASYSGHVRERPRAPDHQYHPHARDARGAGGEVGPPRDPDAHRSGRLL